ncbi:uncharacterized protein Dana_GF20097 [Drosophila ananassae]|uniref:Uncharacterized protein n=1 Tax=Drosophila ananassae TaxID=7217 RepID=B3M7S5_DROAN|nr:uncharacterized protein Dana_GF20097 [Drosophila ananassae]
MCSLVAVSIHIGLPCPGSASIIHHASRRQRPSGPGTSIPAMRLCPSCLMVF